MRWRVIEKIVKQDQKTQEKISNPLRKFSQVFDENKDDTIPFSLQNDENKATTTRRSIASEIRMDESKLEDLFRAIFFFSSSSQVGGSTNMTRLNGVNSEVTNGKIIIGEVFQLAAGRCLRGPPTNKITHGMIRNGDSAVFYFSKSRVQTSANVVHATEG